MEEWRDIRDYIGLYQVSNLARVRSVNRIVIDVFKGKQRVRHFKEKIKEPTLKKDGYLVVTIWKNGVQDTKLIHQLVAEAFLPNPNGYDIVHHKNHDQTDNRIENLEWISKEEHNAMHASERAEQQSKVVYQYDLESQEIVNVWKSTAEVEKVLGFSNSAISKCCNNKFNREGNNVYKGYIWSYSPLA